MKAIQIVSLDGPDAVQLNDVPTPEPGEGQVLIRVRASGVSFPELLQTRGLYQFKPPLPFVPGIGGGRRHRVRSRRLRLRHR